MAVIQKASTEGPSTEQTKFHEKRALLIKLSQSVQTICQLALRADYSHAFFRVDERPERRLATHLMRLHLEFAELLQEEGALWKIVDERNDDPRCRTREEAIADVCRLLRLGGSHEVSGLPNGVLVEELFREYSRPWEGIARTYVNKVWDAVFAFLNMVLEHCIGSDISEKISQLWLSPIMSQKLNDASTKLDQLLEAHEGSLMINSPFFWRDRQRARQERKKSDIEKRLEKVFGGLGSVNRSIALAVCFDEPDMDHTLAEDTFADMNAYYDIKLKVFMDNVPTLATQAAIIRNLDAAFCPAAILDMQADKVMSIASDLVASDLQRKATTLKAPVYMPSLIEKKTPVDPLAPRTNDLKASQQPDITLEPALHCAPGSKSSLGGFQDKTVMTKNERDIEHTAGNNTPDSVKISSKQQDLNSQEAMGDGQEVQPKEFQPIHVPSLHPSITVATNGQFISSSNTFTVPSSTPSPVASPSIVSPSQYKQQPTTTILPSLPASSPVQAIVESLVGPTTKPSSLPRAKPTVDQANPINTNTASSTNTQWTSWEGSSTPPTVSTSKSVFGQAVFGMAPSPLAPKFSQKTGSGYVSPAGFAAFAKQNNGFNVLGASASESIFAPKSDSSAPTPRDNFGSNTFPTQTSSSTPILGSAPDANTSNSLFGQPAVSGMFGSSPGTVGGSMFRTRPNSSAPTAGGNSAGNNIPPAPASYTSFTRNSSFGQPPVSGSNPFGSSPSPAQNFRF